MRGRARRRATGPSAPASRRLRRGRLPPPRQSSGRAAGKGSEARAARPLAEALPSATPDSEQARGPSVPPPATIQVSVSDRNVLQSASSLLTVTEAEAEAQRPRAERLHEEARCTPSPPPAPSCLPRLCPFPALLPGVEEKGPRRFSEVSRRSPSPGGSRARRNPQPLAMPRVPFRLPRPLAVAPGFLHASAKSSLNSQETPGVDAAPRL